MTDTGNFALALDNTSNGGIISPKHVAVNTGAVTVNNFGSGAVTLSGNNLYTAKPPSSTLASCRCRRALGR